MRFLTATQQCFAGEERCVSCLAESEIRAGFPSAMMVVWENEAAPSLSVTENCVPSSPSLHLHSPHCLPVPALPRTAGLLPLRRGLPVCRQPVQQPQGLPRRQRRRAGLLLLLQLLLSVHGEGVATIYGLPGWYPSDELSE